MFDHLIEVNNLLPTFAKYNLADKDVTFIKELISGAALEENSSKVCVCIFQLQSLPLFTNFVLFLNSLYSSVSRPKVLQKPVYILPYSIAVKSYRRVLK